MNTEKIINERLQKIALKNQKVDLNMVKNVESNSAKANSLYEQGVKKIFSAEGEINSAIQTLEQSLRKATETLKEGEELEKLADNIGADLKSTTIKAIQNAFNTVQAANQSIKDLKKAKSIIK